MFYHPPSSLATAPDVPVLIVPSSQGARAQERRLDGLQEETDALRVQLADAEAALQDVLRGEAEAHVELASLQTQVKGAVDAVQVTQDEAAHVKMLEA